MKDIIYSILCLTIEVGTLLFFASHHALSGGFTIILLILIAKNVFVLYTNLNNKQPQKDKTQPDAGISTDEVPAAEEAVFSEKSLVRIERELSENTPNIKNK